MICFQVGMENRHFSHNLMDDKFGSCFFRNVGLNVLKAINLSNQAILKKLSGP
jgi:hypothetical protein